MGVVAIQPCKLRKNRKTNRSIAETESSRTFERLTKKSLSRRTFRSNSLVSFQPVLQNSSKIQKTRSWLAWHLITLAKRVQKAVYGFNNFFRIFSSIKRCFFPTHCASNYLGALEPFGCFPDQRLDSNRKSILRTENSAKVLWKISFPCQSFELSQHYW